MAQQSKRWVPWYSILISIILVAITGVTFWHLYRKPQLMRSDYIAQDVQNLADIFTQINDTCSIISFDRVHNYISFLNVVMFHGSEVGPMNLRYPEAWQGPYLKDNPTIQGISYMVLAADQGHFVVPGEGVTLSNGMQIGKDIVLDEHTDMEKLMQDEQALQHNGKQLATQIPVDGP